MTGETARSESGWTVDTYAAHNEALRQAEEKFQLERDRRYSEIAVEREKALKIKETADLAALGLARDIQIYKDEKANELRSQIERERGSYAQHSDLAALASKWEAQIKPIADYVTGQQGRSQGIGISATVIAFTITASLTILGILAVVATYLATH